ncbi:hypothetical protein SNE40_005201 [Patella caerulea]|uniref:Protein phosphatase 1 regulatory subunit 7 n=1 Tax=Patella caerulea TaxID=87958 RepID=A0AAN8Q4D3_PATCE
MNTKLKARVISSVGRPVGVLPLDPRPKQQRRIPSKLTDPADLSLNLTELRSGKDSQSNSASRSAGSKRSSHSTRSRSGSGSRSKPNRAKSNTSVVGKRCGSEATYDTDDEDQGQDVKFYDVQSSRSRPPTAFGEPMAKKTIDPLEILSINQESEYNKVYEIIRHGEDLTYIDNLQKFERLKILDLSCNHIEQISGLDKNTDLRELKLYDNKIKVIENLECLKDLSCLQLQHNRIKTIGKGLIPVKKLKTLRLDSNQILKLESSDFISCVQLTSLDLSFNMLDNLSALNYLPNLEEVNACGNRLRKISDLSRCRKLVEVDFSNNRLTDLSGLNKSTNLQILKLSNNHLTSFSSIAKLKSVEEVDVSGNRLSELSPLSCLFPSLQIFSVCDNKIVSWQEVLSLSKVPELVELFISGNPFGLEDGEKPHYYTEIQKLLPNLEILDGAHVKRSTSKTTAPLMRPMSASTVVSVRQMDNQLKAVSQELSDLKTSIAQRFESLRTTCQSLPAEPPPSSARTVYGPSPAPSDKEPEIRSCSRRSRIRQAQEFAASQQFT